MFCPELSNIDSSDLIAVAAVLVSGLAALYAKWAWREANRANELTLLGHRKAIYDAFFALKAHMTQYDQSAQINEVSKFFYPSRDASLYFAPKLAELISDYYAACFRVANLARARPLSEEELIDIQTNLEKSAKLAPEIEKSIYCVISRVSESG